MNLFIKVTIEHTHERDYLKRVGKDNWVNLNKYGVEVPHNPIRTNVDDSMVMGWLAAGEVELLKGEPTFEKQYPRLFENSNCYVRYDSKNTGRVFNRLSGLMSDAVYPMEPWVSQYAKEITNKQVKERLLKIFN